MNQEPADTPRRAPGDVEVLQPLPDGELGSVGIGIDVGGTKVLVCVVSSDGIVLGAATGGSPDSLEELLPTLTGAIDALFGDAHLGTRSISGLGLALPGLVDDLGVLHAAPNLGAAISTFDARNELVASLIEHLAKELGTEVDPALVTIENDATCAAIAEAVAGAAADVSDAVVISIGTGIGAGIIANGHVVRGDRHFAGEIGHMTMRHDGPICACGRRGCWEVFASGTALAAFARKAAGENGGEALRQLAGGQAEDARGEHVIAAAEQGDASSLAVLNTYAEWIGLGLTNVVEFLDPALIVLGGGVMNAGDLLLQRVQAAFVHTSRAAQRREHNVIVWAKFQDQAAAIGAALLGLGKLR